MNIVLTSSLGNIGKPLAQELVQGGHSVTVISRVAAVMNEWVAKGFIEMQRCQVNGEL